MGTKHNTDGFEKHQRVKYTGGHTNPYHINGVRGELGVVSSINDSYVFVKFDTPWLCLVDGDANYTAQACDPDDLWPDNSRFKIRLKKETIKLSDEGPVLWFARYICGDE